MNNTHVLCFVMGYQGGTVHQIAKELGVTTDAILDANEQQMGDLCRLAQQVTWKQGGINSQLVKHLRRCSNALNGRYEADGLPSPEWLKTAIGVCGIIAECYPPEPSA